MQVTNIQNQTNFNGRAYIISGKTVLKNAVKQINSMRLMRDANFNLYIGESTFFPDKICVVAAKDEQDIYHWVSVPKTGMLSSKHPLKVIDTAKFVIAEHSEKLKQQNPDKQSIFRKIWNLFK